MGNIDPGHLVEKNGGLGADHKKTLSEHYTLIFNVFVWMQLFNEINCRNLNGEFNVFKGFFKIWLFPFVLGSTAVIQVVMIQYGSHALHVHEGGLSLELWIVSVVIGAMSLPVQQAINFLFASNSLLL